MQGRCGRRSFSGRPQHLVGDPPPLQCHPQLVGRLQQSNYPRVNDFRGQPQPVSAGIVVGGGPGSQVQDRPVPRIERIRPPSAAPLDHPRLRRQNIRGSGCELEVDSRVNSRIVLGILPCFQGKSAVGNVHLHVDDVGSDVENGTLAVGSFRKRAKSSPEWRSGPHFRTMDQGPGHRSGRSS